jgi:hypothetical protein
VHEKVTFWTLDLNTNEKKNTFSKSVGNLRIFSIFLIYTEKTNNSFDISVSSISVLREDNPQKTQSSGSLFKKNSEGN